MQHDPREESEDWPEPKSVPQTQGGHDDHTNGTLVISGISPIDELAMCKARGGVVSSNVESSCCIGAAGPSRDLSSCSKTVVRLSHKLSIRSDDRCLFSIQNVSFSYFNALTTVAWVLCEDSIVEDQSYSGHDQSKTWS